jgi:hypothetical protein
MFLTAALTAQLVFLSHSFRLIAAHAAAAAPHAAGLLGLLHRVHLASVLQPGLLLFALAQTPLGCVLAFLLARSLLAAAANLTTNEYFNRARYLHLRHETAGFCNRWAGVAAGWGGVGWGGGPVWGPRVGQLPGGAFLPDKLALESHVPRR